MDKRTVKQIKILKKKPEFVYNLEIPDNNNYFINGILLHNSPNVVLDESSLTDDIQYAGVRRMLGGHKDNFLFEIGNPFRRNHFFKSSRDPLFHQLVIDYKQGIDEGRITDDFIDEMRKQAQFSVLYECKFPDADAVDNQGYSPLLIEADLDRAYVGEGLQSFGEKREGIDVAGGGRNKSAIIIRSDNVAKVVYYADTKDTMALTGEALRIQKEEKIKPLNVFPDKIGVGKGLNDRLEEQLTKISGVNFGEKPEGEEDFINMRAQCYWRMAEWVKQGGKLERHEKWEELLNIKYKVQSDRKIKIMSKDDMAKLGIESPDVADAMALTFARETKLNNKARNFKQPAWQSNNPYEA